MNIGIVKSWDKDTESGQIVSDGQDYSFAYADGRTVVSSDDAAEPTFGRHIQPEGFGLKEPRVGDAVVFKVDDSSINWAYAEHYLSAVTRKSPSEFRVTVL